MLTRKKFAREEPPVKHAQRLTKEQRSYLGSTGREPVQEVFWTHPRSGDEKFNERFQAIDAGYRNYLHEFYADKAEEDE
ncbi:MAG: hypothetical protein CL843_19650 [Crocinitomicaceae bacterium]|nr:hypothetical protein [Crocinitomicaceae bacterium]